MEIIVLSMFPNWDLRSCLFIASFYERNFLFFLKGDLDTMYLYKGFVTLLVLTKCVNALIHPVEIRGKHFFDSVIDKPVC